LFRHSQFMVEIRSFRPLGKSGLQVLTSSTLIKIQGLLIAIIFTTLFGIRGYGSFQFIIATISTLAAISTSGLPSLLSVAFASNLSSTISKSLRTRFTVFFVGVVLLSAILTIFFSTLYNILFPKIVSNAENYSALTRNQVSLLIIFWTPIYAANQLYSSALFGLKKFNFLVKVNIFRLGMYLLILTSKVLFVQSEFGVLTLVLLIDFIFLLIQGKFSGFFIRINRKDIYKQYFLLKRVSSGKFIIVETACSNLLIVMGLWTLQRFLVSGPGGYSSNGYLGIVLRLVSLVNFIPIAYSNILIPFFSKENAESTQLPSFKRVFVRSIQIIILWLVAFIAASYLFAPYINSSLGSFGKELVHDRWVVLLIATSQILNTFSSSALLAAQKFRTWIKSDYILGGILLVFVWLFRDTSTRLEIVMWATIVAYGSSAFYSLTKLALHFRNQDLIMRPDVQGEI